MFENVFQEKCRPSPIRKEELGNVVEVELKIEDGKINILERFHKITGNIYENIDNVSEYPIDDKTVINLL